MVLAISGIIQVSVLKLNHQRYHNWSFLPLGQKTGFMEIKPFLFPRMVSITFFLLCLNILPKYLNTVDLDGPNPDVAWEATWGSASVARQPQWAPDIPSAEVGSPRQGNFTPGGFLYVIVCHRVEVSRETTALPSSWVIYHSVGLFALLRSNKGKCGNSKTLLVQCCLQRSTLSPLYCLFAVLLPFLHCCDLQGGCQSTAGGQNSEGNSIKDRVL